MMKMKSKVKLIVVHMNKKCVQYSDLASLCYVVLDTASSETRASLQHFCEEMDSTSDIYAYKMNALLQLYGWDGCYC